MKEKYKEFLLNNIEIIFILAQETDYPILEYCKNNEDFFECNFNSPMEAVRAAYYGDYNYADDYVKFNGYGNLESVKEYELIEIIHRYIDDFIDNFIQNKYITDYLDREIKDLNEL